MIGNMIKGKEKAQESGSKVTSIICKVLFFEQLRLLQKSPDWPEIFRDAKPVPADESSQIPMAQQDVDGEIDSSDDSMPLPPLEAYTNRLRPFGVQFDAETDSDS
ncbi:BnaC01g19880D [Brassica napus]|nr:BnaC01g19880D [Brassica napus]